MKWYNGFSPSQRMAGDKIIKEAIKRGELKPLDKVSCSICGQDKGIRHYHTEDYTPENIVKASVPLCWRCHMMIHCRHRHPEEVEKYFDEINKGARYAPVYIHNFKILEEHGIK